MLWNFKNIINYFHKEAVLEEIATVEKANVFHYFRFNETLRKGVTENTKRNHIIINKKKYLC